MGNLCSTEPNYEGPISIFAVSPDFQIIGEITRMADIDPTTKRIILSFCREQQYSPQPVQNFMLIFHEMSNYGHIKKLS